MTDYSRRDRWYSCPEIIKDVDAFYIYGTMYVRSSAEEGAPDHAAIDNPEMLERVPDDYEAHASVFEDSANVFVPFYRQAGLRFAGETLVKDRGHRCCDLRDTVRRHNRRARLVL